MFKLGPVTFVYLAHQMVAIGFFLNFLPSRSQADKGLGSIISGKSRLIMVYIRSQSKGQKYDCMSLHTFVSKIRATRANIIVRF